MGEALSEVLLEDVVAIPLLVWVLAFISDGFFVGSLKFIPKLFFASRKIWYVGTTYAAPEFGLPATI